MKEPENMTNTKKKRGVIFKIVAFIAILSVVFFIFLIASVIENYANVPSRDSLAIKYVKQEFRDLYENCSSDRIDELRQRAKKTVYRDIVFLEPQTDHDEILVIAYWHNKYRGKDFFVVLHKNGEITVANAKPK